MQIQPVVAALHSIVTMPGHEADTIEDLPVAVPFEIQHSLLPALADPVSVDLALADLQPFVSSFSSSFS